MALINGTKSTKKEKIKVELNVEVLAKIRQYCEWASIDEIAFFIEEAACFVFAKDKSFKDHEKAINRRAKQENKELS
jgi:hypothetical protein